MYVRSDNRSCELHIPVLLEAFLTQVLPATGTWIDGTLGAGGYTRALLDQGVDHVIAIDCDPSTIAMARNWSNSYARRLTLVEGDFAELDQHADTPVQGVVLDVGVSSMQLDDPNRGFSFLHDGPLDMRMSKRGPTAADVVNRASEHEIAKILRFFGNEPASRKIARRIAVERAREPILTTSRLAEIISRSRRTAGRRKVHPATRAFQALRIAVNDELGKLARGLHAAERILATGGLLAVISFHSLEDRIVQRFMTGFTGAANRHAPPPKGHSPRFELITRKAIVPQSAEVAANARCRSARLRIARRLTTRPHRNDERTVMPFSSNEFLRSFRSPPAMHVRT